MKSFILLVGALLISSISFANASGLSKGSPQLNALGSAWRAHPSVKESPNDITIVYGGEDVSRRPTLASRITIA